MQLKIIGQPVTFLANSEMVPAREHLSCKNGVCMCGGNIFAYSSKWILSGSAMVPVVTY